MSAPKPKAHVFTEPCFGVLVTGTHDIEVARALAALLVSANWGEPVAEWFEQNPPKIKVGRIVPARPDDASGVSWWWRTGYKIGKPGVTRAVVFDDTPAVG